MNGNCEITFIRRRGRFLAAIAAAFLYGVLGLGWNDDAVCE